MKAENLGKQQKQRKTKAADNIHRGGGGKPHKTIGNIIKTKENTGGG